jgi:hypothetical protein
MAHDPAFDLKFPRHFAPRVNRSMSHGSRLALGIARPATNNIIDEGGSETWSHGQQARCQSASFLGAGMGAGASAGLGIGGHLASDDEHQHP